MSNAGRFHIGKEFFCGSTFPVPILNPVGFGVGPGLTQGSAYFGGPTYMGHASGCFGDATLAVGRCLNPTPLVAPAAKRAKSLFKVSNRGLPPVLNPIDVMLGDPVVGMVGIMANSTMVNIINATFMNINSLGPIFIQSSKYVGIAGLKIMTGAEIRAALIAEICAIINEDIGTPMDKIKVVVSGAFCEQPSIGLIKAIEEAGCYVVDDDYMLGSRMILSDF